MKSSLGKQIRKHIRILLLLVLSVFMAADIIPASGAYISGGFSSGPVMQAERFDGQGSRILSAKKKKKKKNNSGSNSNNNNGNNNSTNNSTNNSSNNNTTDNNNGSSDGGSRNTDTGAASEQKSDSASSGTEDELTVTEDGTYTSKEEVALYIHLYDHLPDNFITKSEAQDLGWSSREGNLDEVAPGKSIGGDRFGNYEGLLPEKNGRKYRECDIDFDGGYRGSKRIIYSNDGLIYYTEDHYKTFERLY